MPAGTSGALIRRARLHNQHLTSAHSGSPAELVARFGAVQAQEYPFAKWGLALRLGDSVEDAAIEAAFTRGEILRTHVMRPTWHFVTASDVGWLLELTGPRIIAATASYFRSNGLDPKLLKRATNIIERALSGGRYLTRRELGQQLARARLQFSALQVGLVSLYGEAERVICSGPRRGRQFTYALLNERVQAARVRTVASDRDEALAELAKRFFGRHGPATLRDFVWWSGLKSADARRGLDIIKATRLEADALTYWFVGDFKGESERSGCVHLLPIYDEYLVAYRDRIAVPHGPTTLHHPTTAVTFRHALVIDGRVAGTWRTEQDGAATVVRVTPMIRLRKEERQGVAAEVERYGRFLRMPVAPAIA